ncbi:MAG: HD domain-containing protein [Spirochaetaceae bacterium]|nr:MAG: HD domain-containing protein [Spirochaetaceae bacterium]
MNKLLLQTITPGKYFSDKLFLDEKYILLSTETPMTQELRSRLERWKFSYIHTAGEPRDQPATDHGEVSASTGNIELDLKESTEFKETYKTYISMMTFTEKMISDFVSKEELSQRLISEKLKEVIDLIKDRRRYALRLTEFRTSTHNHIVDHAVKTSFLAVALGMSLKLPPHKLIELATASLLHEIGLVRLPPQLYMSNRKLNPQEKKAITAHTVLGFKILKQFSFPMPVCLGVLECREHPDGSGYPRGLTAERISVYAKIIGVSSAYAALISDRPHRKAFLGHESILDLLKGRGRNYDDGVLKALLANLSIYPIGSYVLLNNGAKAMVIETNSESPRNPAVRVVAGPNNERYSSSQVVNTQEKEYQIVRALSREEKLEIAPESTQQG